MATSDQSQTEAAQTLSMLYGSAPLAIAALGLADLTFFWLNTAAEKLLGYRPRDLPSLAPMGLVDKTHRERVASALQSAHESGAPTGAVDVNLCSANDQILPIEMRLSIVPLQEEPTAVLFFSDHSELAVLREELSNARSYLESAPDATVVVDREGNIVTSNQQVQNLLGYAQGELIGQRVETLIPDRFRHSHVQHRQSFVGAPQTRGMGEALHLFALTKSGEEIPIEVSLNPIATSDGMLVAAALRDTTQRRRAEQALRESEARYRALFDNAKDLVQGFSADGTLEFVNPSWLNAMGYTPDEAVSLNFFDLVEPASVGAARALLNKAKTGPQVTDVELVYRTRSDTLLQLEGSISRQISTSGRESFRGIFHDVTERKHYEASLRHSRDVAEKATAGKSRFLAAASHDLRQPLQALRLYLSVLQRRLEATKDLDVVGKMGGSIDTMSDLLDALLDISRLDSGAIEPEYSEFSSRALFDNILSSNLQQAQEKGLALNITGDDYQLHSDSGLLARIVDNFVTNAIRYTPEGSVTLAAHAIEGGIKLSVSDTGIGIPLDQHDMVFEEYYQLDNPVRNRQKGLGLGLSIVKHITALLDVPISLTSTPGAGSEFAITVPAGTQPQPLHDNHTQAPVAPLGPASVLFVDDDTSIVEAMVLLLQSANFVVHTAATAEDAIELIADGLRPAALVTDYRLPGKSGVDVIRYAQSDCGAELPCILISGDTAIEHLTQELSSNCHLLRKPVNTDDFVGLLQSLTQNVHAQG